MEKVSKGFYLGSTAGGAGLGIILLIVGMVKIEIGIMLFSIIPTVYAAIVGLVLTYKAWASIQDGHARTTPGRAVGFAFIPIYNLYWIFQAIWGFAKDYNSYIARHEVVTARLPEGLFLSFCILSLCSMFLSRVQYLGIALSIVEFIIGIVMVSKTCDAINSLQQLEILAKKPESNNSGG